MGSDIAALEIIRPLDQAPLSRHRDRPEPHQVQPTGIYISRGEPSSIKRRLDSEPASSTPQPPLSKIQPFLRIGHRAAKQLLRAIARLAKLRKRGQRILH